MQDQHLGRRRGSLRLAEIELEAQRRELRIGVAHDLRGGAIAALPLAQLVAAAGAAEFHDSSFASTGVASTGVASAGAAVGSASGTPSARARCFLASFSCWRALRDISFWRRAWW